MNGRPCVRCGNADKLGGPMSDDWRGDDEGDKIPALCSEVQMAFGLIAWMCHDCRREYFRVAKDSPLTAEYGEAAFRLEFWKARLGPDTSADAVEEGLRLWREVERIEIDVNIVANKWLITDSDDSDEFDEFE